MYKVFILVLALICHLADAQGATLSGFVTDKSGAPVVRGDLDFDRAADGLRLFTPGDNTDINGFYTVTVLPNVYHVSFAPPPNSHLLGLRLFNVSLLTSKELNVTLDSGIVITGTVRDTSGAPIPLVNLAVDSLGAGRVYTPGDKTDITGKYWIVVPAHDSYRIRYEPPPGFNLQVGQVDSIAIQSDTTINITLVPGIALSGAIQRTDGSPVSLAKLTLKRTSDGIKVPLANNKTDSLGIYHVITQPGQYALQYAPPPGEALIGVEIDSVTLTADTTIDVSFTSGVRVVATVTDANGFPLENADLDATRESDRVRLYTPHDKTDANGVATIVLPVDNYEIKADPPPNVILDRVILRNVVVVNDTSLTFILNPLNRVNISGRVVNRQGIGVADVAIGALVLPGMLPGKVKSPFSDSLGFFDATVPVGALDILFNPPRGSRYTGKRLAGVPLVQDSSLGNVQLDTGVVLTAHVVTLDGQPASGYDLSLLTNGAELFTPHDSVNMFGEVVVTAPPGVYDIAVVPQPGTVGDSLALSGVALNADTVFTMVLGSNPSQTPATFILRQNYPNPFNGVTRIPYLLNSQATVTLTVHNILGQVVRMFKYGEQTPGYYTPEWDGTDRNGAAVASGVYFYRLCASKEEVTHKMLLIE